jgi:hypothetical protein
MGYRYLLIAALVLSACEVHAQTGITRVWAVDDGEKVRQDDLAHWAATSANNIVWDGRRVSLFSARNEVVAFQLIIEAGPAGAQQVTVEIDSLSAATAVIKNSGPAGDPSDFRGKHIELFVEHYTQVTQRSPTYSGFGLPNAQAKPDADHLGWIPDALVPFEAPVKNPAHGQGGAPFPIGARKNQGVWVDIYVSKDTPKGTYAGTIKIIEAGTIVQRIPLELRVFGFALPDENHHNLFIAWNEEFLPNRYGIAYNSARYWEVFRKFMNLSHRHRLSLVDGRRSLDGASGFIQNLGGYYTGEYFTPGYRYEGPGMNTGDRVYSIGTYDQPSNGAVSGFAPNTKEAWQKAADAWEGWFRDKAPNTLRFKYMDDEGDVTNPLVVQAIKDKCSWITSSAGVGRNLHRFFTKEFVYQGFYDYIDIWAMSDAPGFQLSILRNRRAQGDRFCSYNGTRPMWGNPELIDLPATDSRVNPWICWKYGVDLLFYWSSSFYAEYNPPHPMGVNVWANNYVPGGNPLGVDKSFGAGMLFYPGVEAQYTEDSRGVDGPITCIRMKNMRRGAQDYEYLWLADQEGVPVSSIVDQIVPRALDDWGTTEYTSARGFNQPPTYPSRGHIYDNARYALAQVLELTGKPGRDPVGTLAAYPLCLPAGGGEVTLSWNSLNASTVAINNGIGTVATAGSRKVFVSKTTMFEINVESGGKQFTANMRVLVNGTAAEIGPNLLRNSNFDNGAQDWNFYSNGVGSIGTEVGKNSPNVCVINITQEGTNVQLFQSDIPLDGNSRYRLTFDGMSTTGNDLQVAVFQHGIPHTNYGLGYSTVDLTPSWTTHVIDFLTENIQGSVNDARLLFWLAPFAKVGDKYGLGRLSLNKISGPSAVEDRPSVPATCVLHQNYPNPFNPTTTVEFQVPAKSQVSLRVFDLLGREVAVLVDGTREAGVYRETFDAAGLPSGPYFCRLVTPTVVQVQKMALLK